MKKFLFLFVLLILAQNIIQAKPRRTLIFTKAGSGSGRIIIQGAKLYLPYTTSKFEEGQKVLVGVDPDSVSTFVGWSGDVTSSNVPVDISVDSDKNIIVTFSLIKRTLTIASTGSGSGKAKVNDTLRTLPYTGLFDHNTVVKLEAVPDGGNSFTGWGGALSGTTNPTTITMNSNKNVTADFTPLKALSITKLGTSPGTGRVSVNGTLQDLPYTGTFVPNTVVDLEAVPDAASSSFTAWGGDLSGAVNPTSITLNGNKSVTAEFALLQRTLSITKLGTGSGQVRVNGTLETLPYSGTFPHNTVVSLEAVPDGATSSFTAWGGDLTGSTNPASITMNNTKSVTIEFTLLQRTLTISNPGTGSGQVKVNGTLQDLPYSGSFDHNTVVTLEAVPDVATSSFTGWGGDLSGITNPVNITMTSNKTVSAAFNLLSRQLMVIENTGTGSGEIKVDDTVSTLPYQRYYPHGTVVKLEAVPNAGTSSFTGWSGALSGTINPTTITMTSDKSLGAEFTLLQRTLSITKLGTGSGQVKVNGTIFTLPYEASFAHNTVVNLEAVPDGATSSFTAWGGDLTGSVTPTTITMNGNKSVTAEFKLIDRQLMVLKSTGTGSGEIKVNDTLRTLPYQQYYPNGTDVKLEAVPDASTSSFTGWSGAVTGTTNPLNITMSGDKSISANFNLLNRQLMVLENTGTGTGQVKVNDIVRTLPYQQYYPHGTVVTVEAAADLDSSSFTGWSGALSGTTNPAAVTMTSDKSLSAEFTLLQRTLSIIKHGTGSGQIKVNGTIYDLPYSVSFAHNTVVNLEAVPDGATSSFTAWGGALSGTSSSTSITMSSDKSVTVELTLLNRSLMVLENTGTGSGQVKVNDTVRTLPYSASYPHGTVVKLEAIPVAATSSFTGWGGDLEGTSTSVVNITMTSDKSVNAIFTLLNRSLMVLQNTGTGSGQVKVNDTVRTLPYSASYSHGTVVKLEAVPDASTSSFAAWGGDLSGSDNPVNLLMTSDKTVSAAFKLLKRSLMVLQNTGTGTGGIKVNDTLRTLPYSASYPHGTIVKLEAVPDAATSSFTGWGGDLSGNTNPVNITMNQDKSFSAEFTLNQFTLKINSAGLGTGQIMVNGVSVNLPFENVFICGTGVVINVNPSEGNSFDSWSGSYTGKNNPLSVKVDSNMTLTATLSIIQKKLTICSKGTGSGRVMVNHELKTLPFKGSFDYKSVVTLQAVPCEGSSFVTWDGDLTGTENPECIKMTFDREVTVKFTSLPDAPVLCSPVDQCGLVTINPVLKWKAVQNVTGYNVQVSTDKDFKCLVLNDTTVTSTCRQIGPLNYNTCYYWRVRAKNCAGSGKFSAVAVFKTEKQPVKPPCNLMAETEYGKIKLFWKDSSDNESGFSVYRKEGNISSVSIYEFLGKVGRNNTVFVDSTIKVNVTYTYKVCAFTVDSVLSYSNEFTIINTLTAVEANGSMPTDYKLYQNYPNPFNPSTVIRYFLKNDSHVKLTVFNSLGKEVSVLVNEFRHSGMNTATFNASDISAGVYFYRIETLEAENGKRYMDVKKLILLK